MAERDLAVIDPDQASPLGDQTGAASWGVIDIFGDLRCDLSWKIRADACDEDGKALEKRDGARLLAGLRGAPTFVVRGEAIGIDDGRSPLALSDMAAEPECLAEGKPALSGKAVLDNGTP